MSGPNHPRGPSNTNQRGSASSRRARKQWLIDTFGDGVTVLCCLHGHRGQHCAHNTTPGSPHRVQP